jgi:RHS repeat-associated protein
MRSSQRCVYFALLLSLAFLAPATRAQITNVTNSTSTPTPGSGHDYIKMLSETVNPANGSVSLRIGTPVPHARALTLPFGFAYDSNGTHMLHSLNGLAAFGSNTTFLSQGGWSYAVPLLSAAAIFKTVRVQNGTFTTCETDTDFMFQGPSGDRHALGLATVFTDHKYCVADDRFLSGGDNFLVATFPNCAGGFCNPVAVADKDGTVFSFRSAFNQHPAGPNGASLPDFVEDRNGNRIVITDNNNGAFTITDTAGRTAISSSGFGVSGDTVTVSGLPGPYTVSWGSAPGNFSINPQVVFPNPSGCRGMGGGGGTGTVVSAISLPNGQKYQFSYESTYGLLSQITYPAGGWVKFTWSLNPQSEFAQFPDLQGNVSGCTYTYDSPAVSHRYVSYDGSTTAFQQDFSYSTTWNSNRTAWVTKQTIVTTHDLIRGGSYQTTYSYASVTQLKPPFDYDVFAAQIPVESTVTHNDWNGAMLRTSTKTWADQYKMTCESTTLESGQISRIDYSYGAGLELTDEKGWDWGQAPICGTAPSGAPTKETATTYQSFAATPIYPTGASIFDRPSSVITYGNGVRVAETDYSYDQTSVANVSNLPSGSHDETNYPATSTAPRGNATTVTNQCFPSCSNTVSTLGYDETGQAFSKTDPKGNITSYSYTDNFDSPPSANTNAYITQITNPTTNGVSHIEKFKYAYTDGQLINSTDQNNQSTQYLYADTLRRLTETDYPDGGQSTISYNDAGPSPTVTASRKITSSQSMTSVSVMDALGHAVQAQLTTDPDGTDFTDTTSDGMGRVWKQSNPHRSAALSTDGTTTYFYDSLGGTCLVVPPDGTLPTGSACPTTSPSNDIFTTYSGNTTTVTDQAGKSRKSVSDGLGRLTQVFEDPAGSNYETDYAYDALNNLLCVAQKGTNSGTFTNCASIPAAWRPRTFTYNSLSRLLTATNPESGAITYTYDANGNLLTKKDARNITATYAYDALNRLTQKSFSDTTPLVKYGYDALAPSGCTPPTLTINNGIGRRTSMCDAAGAEAWSYDITANVGWKTTDTRTTNGVTKTAVSQSNLAGSLVTLTYPVGGEVLTYAPGGAGRPLSAIGGSTYVSAAQYTPSGGLCYFQTFWGNTFTHHYTFNNRLQPVRMQVFGTGYGSAPSPCAASTDTAGTQMNLTYNFVDASGHNNGNVASITNNLDSTRTQSFTYDSLNRIATAKTTSTTGTKCWDEQFGYDPWGNLLSIGRITGYSCSNEELLNVAATTKNQISGDTYDSAGNLTSIPAVATYTYNAENQLLTAGGVTYTYDGDGKRVMKTGGTLYWYGGGSDPLQESNLTGSNVYTHYYFNGMRIARREPSNWVDHYALDHLGNTRWVYGNNGTYDVSDFYPFGGERVITSSAGNRYKFTGKERDSESGLDNFGARYNSSTIGRFMSPDWSASPTTVPYSNFANPQSLNLYSYVANNPLNRIDPLGHNWFFINGQWKWYDGANVTNGGKECKAHTKGCNHSDYTALLVAEATGTNKKGATTYSLTLYDQNKRVFTGTAFSGGGGNPAIKDGNYIIRLDIRNPSPTTLNPNSPLNNPSQDYGIQRMHNITDANGVTWGVVGAYGAIRARLNPWPGQPDGYDFFHGQSNGYGYTHGCLCYGTDTRMIDYMWNNMGNTRVGAAVDTPVVQP